MRLQWGLIIAVMCLGVGCASNSKDFKNLERTPQSEEKGNGSIGSGGLPVSLVETYGRVLSAQTLDFNDDAQMDRAILVQGAETDEVDLIIILSVGEPNAKVFTKKGVAYSGTMWGMLPSLKINNRGSLVVESENYGVGRYKWGQNMTVVLRDSRLLVAGLEYHMVDGISPDNGGSCEVNFLTGKVLRNRKVVNEKVSPTLLATWDKNNLPRACQFE